MAGHSEFVKLQAQVQDLQARLDAVREWAEAAQFNSDVNAENPIERAQERARKGAAQHVLSLLRVSDPVADLRGLKDPNHPAMKGHRPAAAQQEAVERRAEPLADSPAKANRWRMGSFDRPEFSDPPPAEDSATEDEPSGADVEIAAAAVRLANERSKR